MIYDLSHAGRAGIDSCGVCGKPYPGGFQAIDKARSTGERLNTGWFYRGGSVYTAYHPNELVCEECNSKALD